MLLSKNVFANLVNVTGSHRQQKITTLDIFQKEVFDGIEGAEIMGSGSEGFDLFTERIGTDSQVICFTGCIDICQHDFICHGKRLGKIVHQSFGTGVCMRLENAPELFMRTIFSSL